MLLNINLPFLFITLEIAYFIGKELNENYFEKWNKGYMWLRFVKCMESLSKRFRINRTILDKKMIK